MPVLLETLRNHHPRPRRLRLRLQLGPLEDHSLLSIAWPGLANPVAEAEPNDTLDRAQPLGNLSVAGQAGVVGAVGNPPPGPRTLTGISSPRPPPTSTWPPATRASVTTAKFEPG
jgi:hypothetical protein